MIETDTVRRAAQRRECAPSDWPRQPQRRSVERGMIESYDTTVLRLAQEVLISNSQYDIAWWAKRG